MKRVLLALALVLALAAVGGSSSIIYSTEPAKAVEVDPMMDPDGASRFPDWLAPCWPFGWEYKCNRNGCAVPCVCWICPSSWTGYCWV